MENECEALPGVAYPGVRDNRFTINTKTGYDDDDCRQFRQQSTFNKVDRVEFNFVAGVYRA